MDPAVHGPRIRARLGVVPQHDTLDEELTVAQNVEVYGRYFGLSRRVVRERARELLAFAQLSERAGSTLRCSGCTSRCCSPGRWSGWPRPGWPSAAGWWAEVSGRPARALPGRAGVGRAGMARMLLERNSRALRQGWRALVGGLVEPVLYLFSLGVGLGGLVGSVPVGDGAGVPYAQFVAPALLATSTMNGAVYDSTFTLFAKLRYRRLYDAVLATPLGPRDVAAGEACWAMLRGEVFAVAFLAVLAAAGLVRSWWAVLAPPAAAVIGWGFGATGVAATTWMRSWVDLDYVQLAVLPMFLFSATFFPLSTYSRPLRWAVELTPLYHAVALQRGLLLDRVDGSLLAHAGVFVVMGVVGTMVASRRLARLLLS